MKKILLLILSAIMLLFVVSCEAENHESDDQKQNHGQAKSNTHEEMANLEYPKCSYVTKERADEIIDFLPLLGYEDKITAISGVAVDTYIATPLSWWLYHDLKVNLPVEEWGGTQYEEYTSKQEQWVVKFSDGDITYVNLLQEGEKDEYDEECKAFDEEVTKFEKALQNDLDNGYYEDAFSHNGEDPCSVVIYNQKTFMYVTFIYPSGHREHGVYDYDMNYICSQTEQNDFESSSKLSG